MSSESQTTPDATLPLSEKEIKDIEILSMQWLLEDTLSTGSAE